MENIKTKTSFLDPVANAKTLGFIIAIIGIFNFLGAFRLMTKAFEFGSTVSVVIGLINVVVGVALYYKKRWGLYLFLLLQIIGILGKVYLLSQGENVSILLDLILTVLLFIWLLPARNRFE